MNGNHHISTTISTSYMVRDDQIVPTPDLLTEAEAIQYLRLDTDGPGNPSQTLQYYREKGLLRATRVGKSLRYQRKDLLKFLDNVTEQINRKAA